MNHSAAVPSSGAGVLSGRVFGLVAAVSFAMLAVLNWLVATHVPFEIQQIGSSYLIMYYHVPSALAMYLLYAVVCVAGILYLVRRSPLWDRVGRAFGAAGILANAVTLLTGSVWAKAAWNHWWDWRDPRLTSVAVAFLMYLGYAALQGSVEDPEKRPRYAAVYGILAAVNLPIIHKAIEWFGPASHPQNVGSRDGRIVATWGFGVLVFMTFYVLLALWKLDRDAVRERIEAALARVRKLEEAGS